MRHGLCNDLGFNDADRSENIRRVGEMAKLMADAGLIILAAFISRFPRRPQDSAGILPEERFVRGFSSVPLEVCRKRDPKRLYAKAVVEIRMLYRYR